MTNDNSNWERDLVAKIALEALREQRKSRRWNVFFKILLFAYLFILLLVFRSGADGVGTFSTEEHTALIAVEGLIAADASANADRLVSGLREAFDNKHAKAVILRINSPGGSPVQAGYLNDEIFRLKAKNPDKRVYAVITDICASGGYYIASAADEIFADKASIVGSIGVVSPGFGFTDTMQKLGVERRLLAAGKAKGFMDPFSPLNPDHVKHVKTLLGDIHQQFINTVKKGRGDRLADSDELFSGLVWTGEQSLELGLVDSLGSSSYVAREIVGAEKIIDYTPGEDVLARLAKRIGTEFADTLLWRLR